MTLPISKSELEVKVGSHLDEVGLISAEADFWGQF
jgi:hypothetical protein